MAETSISPAVRAFLESMQVPCILSTLRPDGHPITSATWYGFMGEAIIVSTPAARNKAKNVRQDPRVSFIVDTKTMPYQGVAIEGSADVVDDHDDACITAIVRRYLGPDAATAMLSRLDARGSRVILRINPTRVRPWAIEPVVQATAVLSQADPDVTPVAAPAVTPEAAPAAAPLGMAETSLRPTTGSD